MTNYWIFQGNPQIFDIVSALNDNNLKTWMVNAHRKSIKEGDKIILWLTGKNSGCYALGKVTSEVYYGVDDETELKYYLKNEENEESDRVNIKITHNLSKNPILKSQIENIDELKNLKGGYQGTNFTSNEAEYNALLKLINMKESFYSNLIMFIDQSQTDNLKYSHYSNSFLGLNVKVSFGQGGVANIPWISFLKDGQSTSNGIYPVYLYYKSLNLLLLSYGISEKSIPVVSWNLIEKTTINEFFKDKGFGKPFRYGSSFVFKAYYIDNLPPKEEIDNDLFDIINQYKSISSSVSSNKLLNEPKLKFNLEVIIEGLKNSNLIFSKKLVSRFTSSILTKPFVILTGLSGSGKTKLAQAFAMWLCENDTQYKIVPVGADWTNREPLLGFPNALKPETYVKPDNGVLDLIISAIGNPQKPYFLILDEMNLSHVERYFADFLSAMESHESILLHSGSKDWVDVPTKLALPENLFIVGTVNIDETTYMFSPKVLDRANVIEFRVTEKEMEGYLQNYQPLNMDALTAQGAAMAADFVQKATDKSLVTPNAALNNKVLLAFFTELKKSGAEFGYRSASEILRFAAVAATIEPDWKHEEIIDAAIMQKLLPKVHGSRNKLSKILPVLGGFCLKNAEKVKEVYLEDKEKTGFETDDNVIYKLSFEKICRMYRNAIENGYASYAEA